MSPFDEKNTDSIPLENPGTRTIHLTESVIKEHSYRPSSEYSSSSNFQNILTGKYLIRNQIWDFPSSSDALRIGKLLGKGGYGEVYEIYHIMRPEQKFALKIPGPPLGLTKGYILNEIQKLKTLNKPGNYHIPKIKYGFFSLFKEQIPYYITHIFSPAERLFPNFSSNLPIDPLITLEIFYMMALGLKYITSHHIVHNDIKPENFMFLHGLPVITDYGTARSYSEINEVELERLEGRLHGTPVWLPPELISIQKQENKEEIYFNLSKVGQKTDVWGLALVLMRYLIGQSLFHDVPLTYKIPDIFYITYQQFYDAKIIQRYRQHVYRKLYRLYESHYPFEETKIFLPKLKNMLFEGESCFEEKIRNFISSLGETEAGQETPINSSRLLINQIVAKKMKLRQRQHSDFEIKEFFLQSFLDFYDMCLAPLQDRIKIYTLVDTLEVIFPGMAMDCQKKVHNTILEPLISMENND